MPAKKHSFTFKHFFIGLIIIIIVLIILGIFFFTPINNFVQNKFLSGRDTPADKIIKDKTADQLAKSAKKKGINATSANRAASTLKQIPMKQIRSAAVNEKQATSLYAKYQGVNPQIASIQVHQIYTNPKYYQIRQDINQGNYPKAIQDFQQISK